MQVSFSHEALLMKQIAHSLATFTLSFSFNIIVLIVLGVVPDWKIIFFPIVILPLFFLGAGIGLILSVVNAVTTEASNVEKMMINLLLFVTPVVYSPKVSNSLLQNVIKYNPLTYPLNSLHILPLHITSPLFELHHQISFL